MCDDCFDDGDAAPAVFPLHEIARAARMIERDIAGEPAPDEAWAVYFGDTSGVLEWRVLDRLARSVDAAKLLLSLSGAGRRPHLQVS